MRSLKDIVTANQDAVRQGVVKPGEAVGTPQLWDVWHGGVRIKVGVTVAQCADIRSIQHECNFVLHVA